MAWIPAVIGAWTSYNDAKTQKRSASDQAKAASQPTNTTRSPWGPSVPYRNQLMGNAMDLWNRTGSGSPGRGGGGVFGGGGGGAGAFDQILASSGYNGPEVANIRALAQAANPSNPQSIGDLHRAIYASGLQQSTKEQLSNAITYGTGGGQQQQQEGDGLWHSTGSGVDISGYLEELLSGKFLNKNPYIDEMVNSLRDDTYNREYPQIDQSAELSSASGSDSHMLERAMALKRFAQAEGALRGGLYDSERNRMVQGLGIGSGYDTNRRGQDLNEQMLPYQQLGSLGQIINQASGDYGEQVSQGPQYSPQHTQDPYSSAFQGGLSAAYLYKNLFQNQGPGQPTVNAPADTYPRNMGPAPKIAPVVSPFTPTSDLTDWSYGKKMSYP